MAGNLIIFETQANNQCPLILGHSLKTAQAPAISEGLGHAAIRYYGFIMIELPFTYF